MKTKIITLFTLLACLSSFAQSTVSGKVEGLNQEPLIAAVVSVFETAENRFVKAAVCIFT